MSFLSLSPAAFFAGLAALGGSLFLLQRLRVRHREVPVVTTLFWREAIEEARARVLVQRFRHPLAYLFVLLLAVLLWTAFARPIFGGREPGRTVLLLDASAAMSLEGRLPEAVRRLRENAARIPRDRRSIVLCGSEPHTVLLPGEDVLLLDSRLRGVEPEPCPPTLEETVLSLAAGGDRPLEIVVFGDAPVRRELLDLLPEGVTVSRGTKPPADLVNRSITALGVAEAASGLAGAVDILFAVAGGAIGEEPAVSIDIGGVPLDGVVPQGRPGAGSNTFVLEDVPARGEILTVRLAASDVFPLDDVARIRLPERAAVRTALRGEVGEPLRTALLADPGVTLVEERPDVFVVEERPDVFVLGEGGVGDAGVPSLRLVAEGAGDAISFTYERGVDGDEPEVVLERLVADLALEEIDAMEIADQAGRAVSLSVTEGDGRGLSLWISLVTDRYDLIARRAFPVLVSRVVRWLAGVATFPPHVQAGRPVAGLPTPHRDGSGAFRDPVGDEFTPPRAEIYREEDGRELAASLLPVPVSDALTPAREAAARGGADEIAPWLTLAAFALLLLEWYFYRRGRMP